MNKHIKALAKRIRAADDLPTASAILNDALRQASYAGLSSAALAVAGMAELDIEVRECAEHAAMLVASS